MNMVVKRDVLQAIEDAATAIEKGRDYCCNQIIFALSGYMGSPEMSFQEVIIEEFWHRFCGQLEGTWYSRSSALGYEVDYFDPSMFVEERVLALVMFHYHVKYNINNCAERLCAALEPLRVSPVEK